MQEFNRVVPVLVDGETFCFDNNNVLSVSQGKVCQWLDSPLEGGIVGEFAMPDGEIPVISVRQLFDREPQADPGEASLIVASTAQGKCGFLVDDVLRGRETVSSSPYPRVARNEDKPYFRGIVGWNEDSTKRVRKTMLLDVDGLLGESQYVGPAFSVTADAEIVGSADSSRRKGQMMLFDLPHFDWDNQVVSISLSVTQVLEVAKPDALMPAPLVSEDVIGFAHWRGYTVPILDLTQQMNLGSLPDATNNRLVIARNMENELVGFYSCNSIRTVTLPIEATPFMMDQVSTNPTVRGTYLTPNGVFVVPAFELPEPALA